MFILCNITYVAALKSFNVNECDMMVVMNMMGISVQRALFLVIKLCNVTGNCATLLILSTADMW